MPKPIAPNAIRYIKLGRHGKWETECINDGIIRVGFGTERLDRFQLCKTGQWEKLKTQFSTEDGNAPKEASRFSNELRHFFEDDGTTLWITFHDDLLYWCFLASSAAPKPHSDGVGVWRRVAKEWSSEDLDGKPLHNSHLAYELKKLAGYPGTSCDVEASAYALGRIYGQPGGVPTSAVTDLIKEMQDHEPSDRLTDAYQRFTPEQIHQIKPIHNAISNRFKKWLVECGVAAPQIKVENWGVDISCHFKYKSYLFELKVCYDQRTRLAIREALGQSLEYSHYPGRETPDYLAIVLDARPSADDIEWMSRLTKTGIEVELFWLDEKEVYSARVTKNPLAQKATRC